MPAAARFVQRHPDQVFILDHMGKPEIRKEFPHAWATGDSHVGRDGQPSTAKSPASSPKSARRSANVDLIRPYFQTVCDAFGPARLMFGSDWPVCLARAQYGQWIEMTEQLIAPFSAPRTRAIFPRDGAKGLSLMKNAIPIFCLVTMALVVVGVKLTHPTAKLESIVWYGNAVHPYITEVRKGAEAFAKDSGVPVYCTVGQEWTQAQDPNVNVEALSTAGYKAFSLFPGDAVAANGLFQMLRDHGQNVVAYGAQPALPTPIPFTVGTNIKGSAMTATEELIRLMGGPRKNPQFVGGEPPM